MFDSAREESVQGAPSWKNNVFFITRAEIMALEEIVIKTCRQYNLQFDFLQTEFGPFVVEKNDVLYFTTKMSDFVIHEASSGLSPNFTMFNYCCSCCRYRLVKKRCAKF